MCKLIELEKEGVDVRCDKAANYGPVILMDARVSLKE